MRSVAFLFSICLFMGSAQAAFVPPVEFLDLSPCREDSFYHPACRWISGQFRSWPEEQSTAVRKFLNPGVELNPTQKQKLESLYIQLRESGLEKIQFVYLNDGAGGDQAETTMNGKVGIIALRPAFFTSEATYGSVSEQRHALIHELFHVYINLTVGSETPDAPFWRDLAHSLEWRNTRGANSLIDPKLKKEAFSRSRTFRQKGEWQQSVEEDIRFARSLGFPSIYGMSRLSEYVPELGAFLIHDATMAGVLPRPVWDVIRRSPLGFLLANEPRPSWLATANARVEAEEVQDQFVGLLFDQNKFICTVFILHHGLVVTSKSCINPAWPTGSHPGVRYSFLSLEFPKVSDAGPPIRVDGMQVTGIIPDSGPSDFAFISYDGKLTEQRMMLPDLKLVREQKEFKSVAQEKLFTLGFAIPDKPQRLLRLKSGTCHVIEPLSQLESNASLIKSDCPGWTGSTGLPVLSAGELPGQFNLWGIVPRQPDMPAYKQDNWGRFTEVGFSPAYLVRDL